MLSKVVVKITKDYHNQHDKGLLPTYEPDTAEEQRLNLTKGIWLKK